MNTILSSSRAIELVAAPTASCSCWHIHSCCFAFCPLVHRLLPCHVGYSCFADHDFPCGIICSSKHAILILITRNLPSTCYQLSARCAL